MDILDVQYDDCCFDFILDKATMDCILSSEKNALDKAYKALQVRAFIHT
jgi:hypothetical protein